MRESTGLRIGIVATYVLTLAACDSGATKTGETDEVGGSIVIAMQNEPRTLLPPLVSQIDEKVVADQIFEPLAWLGDAGHLDRDFRPGIADTWTWEKDSTAIAFHLNPRARWQDGVPVRASDVTFTYAFHMDSTVGFKDRSSLTHVDSVTAPDSVTAVFWFNKRYPEQLYDAATRLLILPEHLLAKEPRATLMTSAFGRQPVGSGRFRFQKWVANQSIELVADTSNYRGRPKLDRLIFTATADPNALTGRVTSGEVDVVVVTTPQEFKSLMARPELKAQILPAYDYAFLLFNTKEPKQRQRPNRLFADIGLRRAITMALNRELFVRSQFDSLGAVSLGPMTHAQPLADTTIATIRYDSTGAARLLDSLGWTLPAGKAIRERGGQPLHFKITTPTVSPNRVLMVQKVQEGLRRAGIDAEVEAIDGNAFVARQTSRDFDVLFDGRHADQSVSGLKAYWSAASSRDPKGQNFGNYENPRFDAHLDSALAARDFAAARTHASEAFTAIVADVPAVWLYEVRTATVMHKRIRPAHVAPTAWWAGLADWSIPPDERLPRDRIGLKVAAR